MKILTCYSARFYGRRGGRKKKNTEEKSNPIESNGNFKKEGCEIQTGELEIRG